MKLHWNVIFPVFLVFITLNLLVGSMSNLVFAPGFEALERKNVRENLHRVQNALQEEIDQLGKETADEAFWDATYAFIEDRNPDYIESDMAGLEDLNIDLGLFVNVAGDVVYGEVDDAAFKGKSSVLESLQVFFIANPALWQHQRVNDHVQGLLVSPVGPLLFSSRPILTSESEGPIKGSLIFAKALSDAAIQNLAKRMELDVTLDSYKSAPVPLTIHESASTTVSITNRALDKQTFVTTLQLSDVRQDSALVLKVQMPRDIVMQGMATIDRFLFWLFWGSMLISLVICWLLHRWYSSRSIVEQGETKYKELANQFQTLLNAIPDDLVVLSPDRKIVWCNNSFIKSAANFQFDPVGHFCFELRGDLAPCDPCLALDCFATGKEQSCLHSLPEGRSVGKRCFPIKNHRGQVDNVIELSHDITDRINAQTERIRTEQLASLGELAAGVAHEVNNPLNGIINYAQILINAAVKENRSPEIPERIVKEGNRVADIVTQLLAFSRKPGIKKMPSNIEGILNDTLALIETHLRKDGIQIETNLPEDLPLILVVHQQIQQVFLNVLINSRDALNQKARAGGAGKKIDIQAEVKDEGYLRISFHDNGAGIPEELLDRITNPFFTTKAEDEGTGLGLSVSHNIIKQHQGKISFESIVNEFTRVTIDLPIHVYEAEHLSQAAVVET